MNSTTQILKRLTPEPKLKELVEAFNELGYLRIFGIPTCPGEIQASGAFVDTTDASRIPQVGTTLNGGDMSLTAPFDSTNPRAQYSKVITGSGHNHEGGPLQDFLGTPAKAGRIDGQFGVTGQNETKQEDKQRDLLDYEHQHDAYGYLSMYPSPSPK